MTGEARLKAFSALRFEFSYRLKDEVEKGPENQHNKNIGICFGEFIKGLSGPGWDDPFIFHLLGSLPIFLPALIRLGNHKEIES